MRTAEILQNVNSFRLTGLRHFLVVFMLMVMAVGMSAAAFFPVLMVVVMLVPVVMAEAWYYPMLMIGVMLVQVVSVV